MKVSTPHAGSRRMESRKLEYLYEYIRGSSLPVSSLSKYFLSRLLVLTRVHLRDRARYTLDTECLHIGMRHDLCCKRLVGLGTMQVPCRVRPFDWSIDCSQACIPHKTFFVGAPVSHHNPNEKNFSGCQRRSVCKLMLSPQNQARSV